MTNNCLISYFTIPVDNYIDLHTHRTSTDQKVTAVLNLMLNETAETPSGLFSVGLHPWYADQLSLQELSRLLDFFSLHQNLIAFGECGLDKKVKISMQIQLDVFELHLKKCLEHKRPAVIHCVKCWEELIETAANYPMVKILHGFNGAPQLTKRLVKAGFSFSVGKAILDPASKIQESIPLIPPSAIFLETDTSPASIQSIYSAAATSLKMAETELKKQIHANFSRLGLAG